MTTIGAPMRLREPRGVFLGADRPHPTNHLPAGPANDPNRPATRPGRRVPGRGQRAGAADGRPESMGLVRMDSELSDVGPDSQRW